MYQIITAVVYSAALFISGSVIAAWCIHHILDQPEEKQTKDYEVQPPTHITGVSQSDLESRKKQSDQNQS